MRIEEQWALVGVIEGGRRGTPRETEEVVIEVFDYYKPSIEGIKQAIIDYRDSMTAEDLENWDIFDYYKLEERYTIGY